METILRKLQGALDYRVMSDKLRPVDGFLDDIEGYVLMLMAEMWPGNGPVVEIGSMFGKSTCWIAEGLQRRGVGQVTAVDHFVGSPEHQIGQNHEVDDITHSGTTFHTFMKNIKDMGYYGVVRPIVASSEEAVVNWKEPIRMLFIDGDHSYEGVRRDTQLWLPHMEPGGILCFHDVQGWPGVTRWYNEVMSRDAGMGEYHELISAGSLRVICRNSAMNQMFEPAA